MSKPSVPPPSTYDLAAHQIRDYVQPLWPGAHAAPFSLRDQDGRSIGLHDDHLAGRPLLLVFINDPGTAGRVCLALAAQRDRLAELQVPVAVISADSDARRNASLRHRMDVDWPVLGDSTGAVFAGYGLHKGSGVSARGVVLTASRQVRAWYDFEDALDDALGAIMSQIEQSLETTPDHWVTSHAPVLQVPGVLTREECAQLIASFEQDQPLMVRPPRSGELAGSYKIPVYEHNRQDRVDQIIRDQATLTFLDERIWGRVVPMVKKAFAYDITRREDLHIARYEGAREGHPMGHRDNVSAATAYRRFALSLNLNDDYEGGEVVFREYGNQKYKSQAGAALVFSSALLHEVLETTRGTRYTLISHFFNEQSLASR